MHIFQTIVLNLFKMQTQILKRRGVRVARWVKGAWGLTERCNYD